MSASPVPGSRTAPHVLAVGGSLPTPLPSLSVTAVSPSAVTDALSDGECVVTAPELPVETALDVIERVDRHALDVPVVACHRDPSAVPSLLDAGAAEVVRVDGPAAARTLDHRVASLVDRHRADRRQARFLEHLSDAYYELDAAWRVLEWNRVMAERVGIPREEALGAVFWELLPEGRESELHGLFDRVRETGVAAAVSSPIPTEELWVEATVWPRSGGGIAVLSEDITERRERERVRRAMFERTFDLVTVLDPDGTVVEANETALHTFDRTREELVGDPIWNAELPVVDREVDDLQSVVARARDGETVRYELAFTDDGERRVLDVSYQPVVDESGSVTDIIVEGRDITELKRVQESLERNNALFAQAQRMASIGGWAYDLETGTLRWTDETLRIHGVDPEYEPTVEEALSFYHPADRETIREAFEGALAGEPFDHELRIVTPDDETRWVRAMGEPAFEDGDVRAVHGTFQDVTDQREQERRFRATFNNAFQLTGMLEPDGTVIEINETALAFGDVSREAVIGEPFWETPWWQTSEADKQRLREAIERARNGEFVRYETRNVGGDRVAHIDFSLKPVVDDAGKVMLLIPEGRDITELKEREAELRRRTEQMEFLNSLLRHDVLNGMTVIAGNAGLLAEATLPEEAQRRARTIQSWADDVTDVIQRVRHVLDALAGEDELVLEPVNVTRLVEAEANHVAVGTDAEVTVDAPESVHARADDLLSEVVGNVLTNAVKHSDRETPHVEVRVEPPDETDRVRIRIADDGPGVSAAMKGDLFDREASTSGGGFGLFFVETMVERYGGRVRVEDNEPRGAVFTIELPATQ
ncbi:PAS domain-containing protein [Natronomonas sp. EA1]|uniref:PAS domain-containing sensor histidine kinase n=1 Tax=Natronomonas sp. EA1 TaxID=3421655 RepID=UPI003EB856EF